MDIYHVFVDLKEGVRDYELTAAAERYLDALLAEGRIAGWRLMRRKLGLGPETLGEFHFMIEIENLAQLDAAFASVSARAQPIEGLHYGVNALVRNFKAALYRDFPDPHRVRGEERF